MKIIMVKILQMLARRVLIRYKPTIIGITGSMGKTATKEAVFSVLLKKYNVRKNVGNYNTEIGLPLTILGANPPGRSPYKWLRIYLGALAYLLFRKNYPQMLVLEMGADRKGDIAQLVKIAPPYVGIITNVGPVHIEQFGSVEGVAREKGIMFRNTVKGGWIIVNADDKETVRLAGYNKGKQVLYSAKGSNAEIQATEISVSRSQNSSTGIAGISFKIVSKGTVTPVLLRGVLGEHQVYPALAAASVAKIFNINNVDVADALQHTKRQPGRMRLLSGIKHTILIDDTYNASPVAMERALETVSDLEVDGKKYAVLGDMLELGGISEAEHRRLGSIVARLGFDVLCVVGERARDIARGAKKKGMSGDFIFQFKNPAEAGLFVQRRIEQGDLVLVKGSRGVRMERIVKEIMAEPERSSELLVH